MELIYLDHNATTPVRTEVFEAMSPWFTDFPFNASSPHLGGRQAAAAVDAARLKIATFFGFSPHGVIFTSGATEANNLALKGVIQNLGSAARLITVATEHHAVLEVVEELSFHGHDATVVKVNSNGQIDEEQLEYELDHGVPGIVSIMAANNETGILTELEKISQVVHSKQWLLHTDATQAVGRVEVSWPNLDLVSISGHKIGGPKGIGALLVRRGIQLEAQMKGGGQERGLRSGTLNVPGIIGLGEAITLLQNFKEEAYRLAELRDEFESRIEQVIPNVQIVGKSSPRLPNTSNIWFVGAEAEAVMANCPALAISAGSACTSLVPTPSHVLTAMGYGSAASECLRFSLGLQTTQKEIQSAVQILAPAIGRVRGLSL